MRASTRDIQFCQKLHAKHGKSYYWATQFFPRELKEATFVLYAFFRVPDEIVDSNPNKSSEQVIQLLEDWKEKWEQAYKTGSSNEPVLRATAIIFKKYKIPLEYSEAFLKAMMTDTHKSRYANYQELEEYMYGSAAVVGLMMSHVIGFSDKTALKYAQSLGEAMQLTNFLRDIKEDYCLRNRIYFPKNEWDQFNLREKDIEEENCDANFIAFVNFQIERARFLYQEAEKGIPLLNKRGRLAVLLASSLYSAILGKIEEKENNIYLGRVKTSSGEKVKLTLKTLWQKKSLL